MTRADMPQDPAAVVRALRSCRETMLTVQRQVRISGPVYYAAHMVTAAIDAFATLLTGERYYFSVGGSTAGGGRLDADAERRAREAGAEPWREGEDGTN